MLPLTVTLHDFRETEKVACRVPTGSRSPGRRRGVLHPWGNLAIFYRDFASSPGLVILGALDDGVDILRAQQGPFDVTITLNE
jgi:hypothetical protein